MSDDDSKRYMLIEALLEIHDRHRRRLDARVSFMWKISLALWSSLALLAGEFLLASHRERAASCATIPVAILLVLLIPVYLYWVCRVAHDNWDDRELAKKWLNKAEQEMWEPSSGSNPRSWLQRHYSQVLQVVITLLLSALLLFASLPKSGSPGGAANYEAKYLGPLPPSGITTTVGGK